MPQSTPLCDFCVQYGTDKVIWGYTPFYHTLLDPRRPYVKTVLEVGICGFRDIPNNVVGASLFVWRDYFPNAEIYGLDNDGRFIFNDQQRIHTRLADAYDQPQFAAALADMGVREGSIDFFVDDAVHEPHFQVKLVHDAWPYIRPGGVFAIEEGCPYKLPNGDIGYMTKDFPSDARTTIVHTHKPEVLLLVHKPPAA